MLGGDLVWNLCRCIIGIRIETVIVFICVSYGGNIHNVHV